MSRYECEIRNRRTDKLIRRHHRIPDPLNLRMSNTLKDDMMKVCAKYTQKINESDLMRRAVANFVEDLNSKPEQGKYLFV